VQSLFLRLYAGLRIDEGMVKEDVVPNGVGIIQTTTPLTANLWDPQSTLFRLFFGINSVGLFYPKANPSIYAGCLATYATMVEQLYSAGVRNFIFLSVLPVNLFR
jgi:hypothetical protein